jgi:hypothetical protein
MGFRDEVLEVAVVPRGDALGDRRRHGEILCYGFLSKRSCNDKKRRYIK